MTAWKAQWLRIIDQRIQAALNPVTKAGTIVERDSSSATAMCVFDGSSLAVPVKVFAGVPAFEGSRVGLCRFGSDWVVVGVHGVAEVVSTVEGTDIIGFTDTTATQGTPVCGLSFVAPPSGSVLILWRARFEATSAVRALVEIALRNGGTLGAGSTFSGSTDARALETPTNARLQAAMQQRVAGLTPGGTYNVVTEHKLSAAGTGSIFDRAITVVPMVN